jgi:hypothetical protein
LNCSESRDLVSYKYKWWSAGLSRRLRAPSLSRFSSYVFFLVDEDVPHLSRGSFSTSFLDFITQGARGASEAQGTREVQEEDNSGIRLWNSGLTATAPVAAN